MEILDIVDEDGNPTGETVDRETAHREGIRHRTSHLWLVRLRDSDRPFTSAKDMLERTEILLQKRSENKDSYPGCYDISSAGHIPAGCGFEESAIRELKEELGISATEAELRYIGIRRHEYEKKFHEEVFHDNQVSKVFMLLRDVPVTDLKLQKEEIESAEWMGLLECMEKVEKDTIKNCIRPQELIMIKKEIEKEYERYSGDF